MTTLPCPFCNQSLAGHSHTSDADAIYHLIGPTARTMRDMAIAKQSTSFMNYIDSGGMLFCDIDYFHLRRVLLTTVKQ